jgi:hypothetical protein
MTVAAPSDAWANLPGSLEVSGLVLADDDGDELRVDDRSWSDLLVVQAWGG